MQLGYILTGQKLVTPEQVCKSDLSRQQVTLLFPLQTATEVVG